MSERWSAAEVLALAPDESSRRSAAGAARSASWSGWGACGDLVWGLCAGSGKSPYQVIAAPAGPSTKCSCPSRKFPCKHALGLLLAWAEGAVPDAAEAADYALAWQQGRSAAASRKKSAGDAPKDAAAAARRASQREARVSAGVAELRTWLADQVRGGLPAAASAGYRHADAIAARMVDAQAPGLASALRALAPVPASGEGWAGRLLAEYAQLHLLARGWEGAAELPAGLAAVVRSRVGFAASREDVLATPAVTDSWQVLGVRELPDAPIPARRTWLRGRLGGRPALLLAFAAGPSGSFGNSPDIGLAPGTETAASLHYYPGQPQLRAAVGRRDPAEDACPPAAGSIASLLQEWAGALAQDPWLTEWPAVVAGIPQPPPDAGPQARAEWALADADGAAVPLLGGASLWTLLAISGGRPVTVAGEWGPRGFLPLTAWHGAQAVAL